MPLVSAAVAAATPVATVVSLANPQTAATSAAILFDTVEENSGALWDAANHRFLIPAGKSGIYAYTVYAIVGADAAITGGHVASNMSGAAPNLDTPLVKDASFGSAWTGTGAMVTYASAGDTISQLIVFTGPASVSVGVSSFCALAYLGPL